MAGVTVSIAPEMLNWIIQKVQFENTNSAVFEVLGKWKSGEKVPTFNQMEDVSKKTNIPFTRVLKNIQAIFMRNG